MLCYVVEFVWKQLYFVYECFSRSLALVSFSIFSVSRDAGWGVACRFGVLDRPHLNPACTAYLPGDVEQMLSLQSFSEDWPYVLGL